MRRETWANLFIFPESAFVLSWEATTLQTQTKLLLPQSHACCSNTWRMTGLLFLFTHAKLQLDRGHFGERIKQQPIMKEKHEIINGNVQRCWIKDALQLWWRCVQALRLCWSHGNSQENMSKMFILLPISSISFHFSPRPENLFATSWCKQLTRCSLVAHSNKPQLKNTPLT